MNSTGFIYKGRADATDARSEARPDFEINGFPTPLQPAKITEVTASGIYQVAPLGDDGEVLTTPGETEEDEAVPVTIDGVRAFPATELSLDQLVWLVFFAGNPVPVILVSGGGGGGCAGFLNNVGVLYDG